MKLLLDTRTFLWIISGDRQLSETAREQYSDPANEVYLGKLPPLHQDPFDRMLVCQALARGLTLLTPDPQIHRYPVPSLW